MEKVKTREEIFHDQVEAKKLEKQKKQKRQPKKDKNAGDYVESFLPEATYLEFLMESLLMDSASKKERKCEFIRVSPRSLQAICFPTIRHDYIKKTLVDRNINVILIMPTISNLDALTRHSVIEWIEHLDQLEQTFDKHYNITFYPRIDHLIPFLKKDMYMEVLGEEVITSYIWSASDLPTVDQLSTLDFPFTTYTGEMCKECGDGGVITACDKCDKWYHIHMAYACVSISKRLADPSNVGVFVCDEW